MPLYEITEDGLKDRPSTAFAALGLRERQDLQRLLRDDIRVLDGDLLVIAEEFGEWEDARRRVDLLAIDRDGQLVVIELKRTEDGGHMELQALRYAAMVSAMGFEDVVSTYRRHLAAVGADDPDLARSRLLEWLEAQDDSDEPPVIASQVRILLVSQDFGRELTTAVIWLNDQYGLDIRCVRMTPYAVGERVLLDVRQVIPLPEAGDYQVRLRRKEQQKERVLRSGRDFTRYHIVVDGVEQASTNKRRSVLGMVRELVNKGVPLAEIAPVLGERHIAVVVGLPGSSDEVADALGQAGRDASRFFVEDAFAGEAETYVLSKMWGRGTEDMLKGLAAAFPHSGVGFREAED